MSNTRNTRRVNGSTWYGIGWPASCNEGWRARYDIAVEYKKVEAPVTINYYQSYEGKWKLVLSVTNSDDGKIVEKNPATRNLNKANTGYQWICLRLWIALLEKLILSLASVLRQMAGPVSS